MKTISIFLALINSLLAGLLITFLISSVDFQSSPRWWSLFRILVALLVIVVGLLTWLDNITQIKNGLMGLSSLALVAIGAGTIVWTLQSAQITGDMQYHMVVYGGSLFVQGIALLLGISQNSGNVFTA